jgi:hypothetical protein
VSVAQMSNAVRKEAKIETITVRWITEIQSLYLRILSLALTLDPPSRVAFSESGPDGMPPALVVDEGFSVGG